MRFWKYMTFIQNIFLLYKFIKRVRLFKKSIVILRIYYILTFSTTWVNSSPVFLFLFIFKWFWMNFGLEWMEWIDFDEVFFVCLKAEVVWSLKIEIAKFIKIFSSIHVLFLFVNKMSDFTEHISHDNWHLSHFNTVGETVCILKTPPESRFFRDKPERNSIVTLFNSQLILNLNGFVLVLIHQSEWPKL